MGAGASELKLEKAGPVRVTARVAALLDETPDDSIRKKPYDQKPYWELERSRIGDTRKVPVELVVNGIAVARQEIAADGVLRPISFDAKIDRSSWIALRILPSSHTNPIFALVGERPIRASKASAEWCLRAVDQCWKSKESRIRLAERGEALRAYEFARKRIGSGSGNRNNSPDAAWARLRTHHHLDAVVQLVVEQAVAFRRFVQIEPMRNQEGRVDLARLDHSRG